MKMRYLFEDYDYLEHFEHMLRNLDWSKVTPEKLKKYNDQLKYFGKKPISSTYNPYDKRKNTDKIMDELKKWKKMNKYAAIGLGAAGLGLGAYGIYKWAKKKKQKSKND